MGSEVNEGRQNISLRLTPAGLEWMKELAFEYNVTRTDIVRAACAVAQKHEKELRAALESMGKRL